MNQLEKQRINALNRMLHIRTCPPSDILFSGGEDVSIHILTCTYCRNMLKMRKLFYNNKQYVLNKNKSDILKRGYIVQVLRSAVKNIYNGSIWIVPPMAVIIEDEDDMQISGMVNLSQIHDSIELATIGDIRLSGKNDGLFAESWNTFYIDTENISWTGCCITNEEYNSIVNSKNKHINTECCQKIIKDFRDQELITSSFYNKEVLKTNNSINYNLISRKQDKKSSHKLYFSEYLDGKLTDILNQDELSLAAESSYESPLSEFPELGIINGKVIIFRATGKSKVIPASFTTIDGRLCTTIRWFYKKPHEAILFAKGKVGSKGKPANISLDNDILTICSDFFEELLDSELAPLVVIKDVE